MSTQSAVRLCCRPSRWAGFIARLAFAVLWVAFFSGMSWLAWTRRAGAPLFALVLVVIFDLITIPVVHDLIVCLRHTMRQHEPRVEIDQESLAYGESVSVRVTEPHPEVVAELAIKLVGECWSKSMTDVSQYRRTTRLYSRCYEEELLRVSTQSDHPVTRILKVRLPECPPAENVCWKLIVDARLKQGGVIEHPFPLRVRETIA